MGKSWFWSKRTPTKYDGRCRRQHPQSELNCCKTKGNILIFKQTHPSNIRWTLSQTAPAVWAKMLVKPLGKHWFWSKRTTATYDGRCRSQHPQWELTCCKTKGNTLIFKQTHPSNIRCTRSQTAPPVRAKTLVKLMVKKGILKQTHPNNIRWTRSQTAPPVWATML